MPGSLDPYRTLGLQPGASADEIRRAYRRLAKANHPDSAGEAALPRFLAIQTAYEILMEGRVRRSTASRNTATGGPSPPTTDPWQAEAARARATRSAYSRRHRPGATDDTATGGAGRGASAPGGGPDPAGATGPAAAAGAGAAEGSRTQGSSERARRPGGRSRPPNKATLGSTSYDAADDEPFEPDWSGGTWYGASSGTYWTLNPKEYADPRKHGPEYQRRARRRLEGGDYDSDEEGPEISGDDFEGQDSESATGSERHGFDGRWAYPDGDPTAPDDQEGAGPQEGPGARQGAGPQEAATYEDRRRQDELPAPEPGLTIGETADRLLAGRVGFVERLLITFVGWLPVAGIIGWVAGELSGCARFTASCVDPAGMWVILANVVVILMLAALPQVAAISAAGMLGALAVSVPAAVILSAAGGAHQPEVAAAVIAIGAVVGYVAGAAFGAGRRVGWRRVP